MTITMTFTLWALVNSALFLSLAINLILGFKILANKYPDFFYERVEK